MKEFKYLEVLFMNKGELECEIDGQLGAVSAVLRALYRSVAVKRELSRRQSFQFASQSTLKPLAVAMSFGS